MTEWTWRCKTGCVMMECHVTATDMPVPGEYKGMCWVNGEDVEWVFTGVTE